MIVSQNLNKEYATIAGLPEFAKASAQLAFGKDMNGLVGLTWLYVLKFRNIFVGKTMFPSFSHWTVSKLEW